MASKIISAKAYANNEVAVVAWQVEDGIVGCLGFEVTRIHLGADDAVLDTRVLPAWVPFKGQSNPKWEPQTTSVWPVQKLVWRDLTLRKLRDATNRRASVRVKYRIRAVVPRKAGLTDVPAPEAQTYSGTPLPLSYADDGFETNIVESKQEHGDNIRAAFTNGILAAQWLGHALAAGGQTLNANAVRTHISTPGDPLRSYLTGDVLALLKELIERAKDDGGTVRLALYELSDQELVDLLVANKKCVRVILSNSSKDRNSAEWDSGNSAARAKLHKEPDFDVQDRMFNNNRIGHNKFAVYFDKREVPVAVLTGSTNWTPTGLCGQTNNAILIEDSKVAAQYADYWTLLEDDTKSFVEPDPLSTSTNNAQGQKIRQANAETPATVTLGDGTTLDIWRAPNTTRTTKGPDIPPDLSALYGVMRKVETAILFAVFNPARSGKLSIVEEAIRLGRLDRSLIVQGSVSDPTAMPNYVAPAQNGAEDAPTTANPPVFDEENVHVVLATALSDHDVIANFEHELLKVGNAVIHDKVVVIDPLSDNCAVVMGSHNLGYKASYENDENLIVIRGNKSLAQAYAVHMLDIYDHYRFRAVQADQTSNGHDKFAGFLSRDDAWLGRALDAQRNMLAKYLGS